MSPESVVAPAIEAAMAARPDRPLVVGLCGAQGSGKSTLAATLSTRIPGAAVLSLDDLYLTRADRLRLAGEVHPLLATRGVPGTHDVGLGTEVMAGIDAGREVALPRFSKACDDRLPRSAWPVAPTGTRVLLFEGWCVGAMPQGEDALAVPVNALERERDPDGRWRRYAEAALAGPYRALFDRIDLLILLAAPDWPTVVTWRLEQEAALRRDEGRGEGVMDDAAVRAFVSHYERLTRHILAEMPARADLVLRLDGRRAATAVDRAARSRSDDRPRPPAPIDGDARSGVRTSRTRRC